MNKRRKEIIAQNEVSKLVTFSLGGYEQKVLIEGRSRKNPVILFLHGGPGSPIPFSEGCRGMFPEITEKAVMVYWDQLGCGINDYPMDDSFCINDLITMTVDLIKEIKKEFPENKLILFGVSFGSVFGSKGGAEVPNLIDGVLTYGQVLNDMTFNEETYQVLEVANLSVKEKEKLKEIKSSKKHSLEDAMTVMKWIRKYTEGYECKTGGKTPLMPILLGILASPDYRLKDFKAIVVNGYRKNTSIIKELIAIDLRETLKQITVPYLILQGSTDIVTSTAALKNWTTQVDNSNICLKIVENSGHIPGESTMKRIMEEIAVFTEE